MDRARQPQLQVGPHSHRQAFPRCVCGCSPTSSTTTWLTKESDGSELSCWRSTPVVQKSSRVLRDWRESRRTA